MTSFNPVSVLATNAGAMISVSGSGLDVSSVRAVRFEPGVTCTGSGASPAAGTVNGTSVQNGSGSGVGVGTLITVTQSVAFGTGSYSVCVDFAANAAGGAFVKVGSSQFLVR